MNCKLLAVIVMVLLTFDPIKVHACGADHNYILLVVEDVNPKLKLFKDLCHDNTCKQVDEWFILRSPTGALVFINQQDIVFVHRGMMLAGSAIPWKDYLQYLASLDRQGLIKFPKSLSDVLTDKMLAEEDRERKDLFVKRQYPYEGLSFVRLKGEYVYFDWDRAENYTKHFDLLIEKMQKRDVGYQFREKLLYFLRKLRLVGYPRGGCDETSDYLPTQPL